MRLSVSKRPNPYKDEEMKDDAPQYSMQEDSKIRGNNKSSPIKDGLMKSDEQLNSVKTVCMANNETHSDALAKLMSNRHRQEEVLEELDKIYTCSVCLKQIKLYDAWNDNPDILNEGDNIELVDEVEFMTKYKCPECYNVACPSCMSKSIADSQSTCTTCSTHYIN